MTVKGFISIDEVLIRGSDILKRKSNFIAVGREQELIDISGVLMKMSKRNLIVTGRGGVGVSALILGLQDSKKDLKTPVEIVSKRFYWLETDKLFESGNQEKINELFQRIRQILVKTRNSILVLEDTVDFIRSAQYSGCMNLINGLMGDLKSGKYQAILESKDDIVGEILKCDGDILEFCSLYEVKEPSLTNLKLIVKEGVRELIVHHGIEISQKALETAIMLTDRYKLSELRAQPDASITLLDHALTDRSRKAHSHPPKIELIENDIRNLGQLLLTTSEPNIIRTKIAELNSQLEGEQRKWNTLQQEIRN